MVQLSFYLYAACFRLGIIAAGIISIYLGYRMFCQGLYTSEDNDKDMEFKASFAGFKFVLKNAAPGIFFAAFGAIIISIMIYSGSPELIMEHQDHVSQEAISENNQQAQTHEKTSYMETRGDRQDNFSTLLDQAKKAIQKKDVQTAMRLYLDILQMAAEPMNELSWQWVQHKPKLLDRALAISKASVAINPDEGNYWDTLSVILYKKGFLAEAYQAKQKAANLDSRFRENLENFKKAAESAHSQ
jgi:tetratricopeptide (TPR) repeat protein